MGSPLQLELFEPELVTYPEPMLRVLSLGAGLQSMTLLLMAIENYRGLETPDLVVFADTGWEPQSTHDQVEFARQRCEQHQVRFEQVSRLVDDPHARPGLKPFPRIHEYWLLAANRTEEDRQESGAWHKDVNPPSAPWWSIGANGNAGKMTRRQCTVDYKIAPIRNLVNQVVREMGVCPGQNPGCVEMWIGFDADEADRRTKNVYAHQVKYIRNRYPLAELGFGRSDLVVWLKERGHPVFLRSACIGCPFRDRNYWADLQPDELEEACRVDDQIRTIPGTTSKWFLWSERRPLRELNEASNG